MGYLEIARRKVVEGKRKVMRDEIDRLFVSEILPRLTALHRAGRLPELATDQAWIEAERLWNKLGEEHPDVSTSEIKEALLQAVKSYEGAV